jgi:hypothetical protein
VTGINCTRERSSEKRFIVSKAYSRRIAGFVVGAGSSMLIVPYCFISMIGGGNNETDHQSTTFQFD